MRSERSRRQGESCWFRVENLDGSKQNEKLLAMHDRPSCLYIGREDVVRMAEMHK
jgi:hypothetical protein